MLKRRIRRLETLVEQSDACENGPNSPALKRLQTVQDVIDLLEEQVEALRAHRWAGAVQKARAIGYLAGVARKAIESGKLVDRMEILERILKQRRG
jgi:predicted alpha/beta-fold hydrolase